MGTLFGLMLPAIQHTRDVSYRAACQNNLRQLGIGLGSYHAVRGQFPPLINITAANDPEALLGWMALILPYLDQDALYLESANACRIDTDTLKNPPHIALKTVVRDFVCPGDGRLFSPQVDEFGLHATFTSYIGNGGCLSPTTRRGLPGVLGYASGCSMSAIVDGSSHTIMVGERPPPATFQSGWWYPSHWWYSEGWRGPNNMLVLGANRVSADDDGCTVGRGLGPGDIHNACDRMHYWSLHFGGANFLFADGSVRYLGYGADSVIYALASIAGGEVVELP